MGYSVVEPAGLPNRTKELTGTKARGVLETRFVLIHIVHPLCYRPVVDTLAINSAYSLGPQP